MTKTMTNIERYLTDEKCKSISPMIRHSQVLKRIEELVVIYDVQFWNIKFYRKNLLDIFIGNPELEDCEIKDELLNFITFPKNLNTT